MTDEDVTDAAPPELTSSAAYKASGTSYRAALAIAADAYSIRCMTGLYEVEIEPEVRSWLASLSDRDFGRVDFLVGLLAEHAQDLGEPYTRHLGGKVRELRFHLLRQQTGGHLLAGTGPAGDITDSLPQVPQRGDRRGHPRPARPDDLRNPAQPGPRHIRPGGGLT